MASKVTVVWTDTTESPYVTIRQAGTASTNFTVDGTAVTFPYRITSTTSFETTRRGTYSVSVQVSGVEIADTPDGEKVVRLDGNGVVLRPSADANAGAVLDRNTWIPRRNFPDRPYDQQMIWGGQSGHNHTGTGVGASFELNDTADFILGDRSSRMVTGGTHAQTFIERVGLTAFDLTNRVPRIWIKLENYTTGTDFSFWMGSGSDWNNRLMWSLQDDPNSLFYPVGEDSAWVAFTCPRSRATSSGTPVQTAITRYRLTCYDNSTSMTVRLGGVATIPDTTAVFPNGVLSLTFDDGIDDQYVEGKGYMDKYGFAGTIYPIIDRLDTAGYMTVDQLKAMEQESGWEVGLHSYTAAVHNASGGLTALSASELVADIVASREFLVTNGMREPENLAYPQGSFDQSTVETLRAWVSSARTTKSGQRNTWPPADRLKLFTRAMSNTDSAATFTALIDDAVANKEWLIFTFHQIEATTPAQTTGTTRAIFRAIVDYAASSGIAVRTVKEVLSAYPGGA